MACTPTRFALRHGDARALLVVYQQGGRTRRRIVSLRSVTADTDAASVARRLAHKHADVLSPQVTSFSQLHTLVLKAQQKLTDAPPPALELGASPSDLPEPVAARGEPVKPLQPLQPSSPRKLGALPSLPPLAGAGTAQGKSSLPPLSVPVGNASAPSPLRSPGARSAGSGPLSPVSPLSSVGSSVHKLGPVSPISSVSSIGGPTQQQGEASEDDSLDDLLADTADAEAPKLSDVLPASGDLNTVAPEQLDQAKQAMESGFRANQLRPGDPGFVYDKQATFDASEPSGWDDEDEVEDEVEDEIDEEVASGSDNESTFSADFSDVDL